MSKSTHCFDLRSALHCLQAIPLHILFELIAVSNPDITHLLHLVQQVLNEHPSGLSEYALIQQLKSRHSAFAQVNLSDPLSLFRTHFMLFHVLYVLRDKLRHTGQYDVLIHTLNIRIQAPSPTQPQTSAVGHEDKLRAYYLDITQLTSTDRDAVEALLYGGLTAMAQPDCVTQALSELELDQPAHSLSAQVIRQQYRALVSRYHPDRGGCTARLQRINQAMDTLRQHRLLR